jgi:hypothetical protein
MSAINAFFIAIFYLIFSILYLSRSRLPVFYALCRIRSIAILHRKEREELFALYKQREKGRRIQDEFDEKLNDAIINITSESLKSKIDKKDLPTSIFPTSIDVSEAPNYYLFDPLEKYKEETKREFIRMFSELICRMCGNRIYGLYVPEEGFELKEMLKDWIPDFYKLKKRSTTAISPEQRDRTE